MYITRAKEPLTESMEEKGKMQQNDESRVKYWPTPRHSAAIMDMSHPAHRMSSSQGTIPEQAQRKSNGMRIADFMLDNDEQRWMNNAMGKSSDSLDAVAPMPPSNISRSSLSRASTPERRSEMVSTARHSTISPLPPPKVPLPGLPGQRASTRTSMRSRADSMPSSIMPSSVSIPPRGRPVTDPRVPTFAQRVFEAGKPDLLYDLDERHRLPWKFQDLKHGVLDLTTLQRMQQHVLQQKLVEQVRAIGEKGAWLEIGIGETLHEYCKVIRDMDYMQQCSLRGSDDPFIMTTNKDLEAQLLEDGHLVRRNAGYAKLSGEEGSLSRLPYMKRQPAYRRRVKRLTMAVSMAIALIVPFLIMSFAPGLLARIITTCGCIMVFAVVAASMGTMRTAYVCFLTVVYAAAVIVFAGVNPPRYIT